MSNLYRLVYTSFRKPACDEAAIENILASCKRNNPGRNITGILMHSNNRFIQYIEGDRNQVEKLYELIKDDPRHTSVNKRNFEQINERVFPSWEMGYKDLSSDNIEFQTEIKNQDEATFNQLINNELDFNNEGMKVLQLFFKMA